jgi:3-hydroxyisobutyrate dehydrogenase-like beta-hydroxyacid dehydrogenase
MKIGFIGLGIMGSRMAANLLRHDYSLVVFNRTREKAEPLRKAGAIVADSPAQLADQVDVLFTMLAQPEAVEQTALGLEGFLNYLPANAAGSTAVRSIPRSRRKWPEKRGADTFVFWTRP